MKRFQFVCFFIFLSSQVLAKEISFEERQFLNESYALELKGRYEDAMKRVMSIFKKNRENYWINLRLGYLFTLTKNYKNAVRHYTAAANIMERSVEPWAGISLLYMNLGDYNRALQANNEVLRRDLSNYYAQIRMTIALIQLKRYEEAYSRVEDGLKLYPSDPTFLEQKGFLLMSFGQVDRAKDVLTTLLMINPQNAYAKSIVKN